MIKIAVPGVSGRMGAAVAAQVLAATDLALALVTARSGDAVVGSKFPNTDLIVQDNLDGNFDVLIDFTLPAGVMEHLAYCLQYRVPMVIGATGFSVEQQQQISAAARIIPILQAANMSLGVNVCNKLLAAAAKHLDNNWQIAISDVHHAHKKDSPSGTAKHMAEVIAQASGRSLSDITIHSERVGEVVGQHSVTFSNPLESLTITHVAHDRAVFASGALVAARWLLGKDPGLYGMGDVV